MYGWSEIRRDYSVQLPPTAVHAYEITSEKKVYLFTGSKSTGGFCVTRKGLLYPSKIGNILSDTPALLAYRLPEGEFVRYLGRGYCWLSVSRKGILQLTEQLMDDLSLHGVTRLLSIRSSDIAFTMGAKGPLIAFAENYRGTIDVY